MVEATYSITQEEFAEAQKLWCPAELKKIPGRSVVLGGAIIFGLIVGLSMRYLPLWLSASIFAMLAFNFGATRWRRKIARKYQFERLRDDLEDLYARLDERGYFYSKSGRHEGLWMWPAFTGFREGPKVFVLGRGLSFVTIPKHALTEEEANATRELLRDHLPA